MMNSSIKWRPQWKIWIPVVLFLMPLILESEMAGTLFTPFLYGIVLIIFAFIYYFRMRIWQAPALMLLTAITMVMYFFMARPERIATTLDLAGMVTGENFVLVLEQYITLPVWFVFLIINFISFLTLGPLFVKALGLERSAIRLFRISARSVDNADNGYTERPLHTGKHSLTENELIAFASFIDHKNICLAQYPDHGIRLLFSMGASPMSHKNREKASWVLFDKEGNLSVFISRSDYRQYRKEYTFDQLCTMMGNTLLRFAEYHKMGNDRLIITELNNA